MAAFLLVSTALYAGFQWTIRLVVYPQFAAVPAGGFAAYETRHQRLVRYAVGPLFLADGVAAGRGCGSCSRGGLVRRRPVTARPNGKINAELWSYVNHKSASIKLQRRGRRGRRELGLMVLRPPWQAG